MGSLVLNALRKNNTDFKHREENSVMQIPAITDFPVFDMMSGYIEKSFGPNGQMIPHLFGGIQPGVMAFIGKSGSGKTSLATKLGANIVARYPNSTLYFRDAEHSTTTARFMDLTGWTPEMVDSMMDYVNIGITHDWVLNDIRNICQAKESLKNEIMIDTGMLDSNGKSIKMYPPDIYILDSISSMNPINDDEIKTGAKVDNVFEVKDAKVTNNTEGMRMAGSTKLLILKILDLLYKYNIRLICIAHITTNTQPGVNPMYIQKQLQYLKQNEKISSGTAFLYQCNSIVRTDYGSRIEEDELGSKINGAKNKLMFVKNKSNISGVPVELIFDQRTGYNALLSCFNYLMNRGYGIEGSPRSMCLKCCPDITFTKRTLWDKLVEEFKTYQNNSRLVKGLIATAQKCLYWDFVMGRPDPNPNNWMNGSPTAISAKNGVTS